MVVIEHRAHMIELRLNDGRSILCSYGVPVAAFLGAEGYVRTNQGLPIASIKHVNQYLCLGLLNNKRHMCVFVAQAELDELLATAA